MTNAWEIIRFGVSAALTLAGLFVLVTGVVGVFRFKYALSRIHAAALLDTLGILLMLAGLMVAQGFTNATLKMFVVILMLWLSSPVSSHLIGRLEITVNDELDRHMAVVDRAAVKLEKEGE